MTQALNIEAGPGNHISTIRQVSLPDGCVFSVVVETHEAFMNEEGADDWVIEFSKETKIECPHGLNWDSSPEQIVWRRFQLYLHKHNLWKSNDGDIAESFMATGVLPKLPMDEARPLVIQLWRVHKWLNSTHLENFPSTHLQPMQVVDLDSRINQDKLPTFQRT